MLVGAMKKKKIIKSHKNTDILFFLPISHFAVRSCSISTSTKLYQNTLKITIDRKIMGKIDKMSQ